MTSFQKLTLFALAAVGFQLWGLKAAFAGKEFNIFDVRKNIPLNDEEPVYHDYYINMGIEDGIKVGNKLLVYRKTPVLDIYRNKAQADLIAPVAQLKIIHAQNSLSIARVLKVVDASRVPVQSQMAVMVGDRVELIADDSAQDETKEDDKTAQK